MYGLAIMLTIPTRTTSKNIDKIHVICFKKAIKAILNLQLVKIDLFFRENLVIPAIVDRAGTGVCKPS